MRLSNFMVVCFLEHYVANSTRPLVRPLIFGWNHLQHTRIAVALARAKVLLFLAKKQKKIPARLSDSYTRMLQMFPRFISTVHA